MFNKLIDERRDEILELSTKKKIVKKPYHCKGKKTHEKSFSDFDDVFSFLKKIKDGNKTPDQA